MSHVGLSRISRLFVGMLFGVLALPLPGNSETITASGVGVVPLSNPDLSSVPVVVYVFVEANGADANSAISQVNAKVQTVKDAAGKAGVDAASFVVNGFSVYPKLEPQPDPSTPAKITEYEASASFQATAFGVEKVGAVINAAIAAGALNVSTSLGGDSQGTSPSANEVAGAVADAMEQARVIAAAAASNAKVKLGRLLAVELRPPQSSFSPIFLNGATRFGRSNTGWQIEAVSTYEVLP